MYVGGKAANGHKRPVEIAFQFQQLRLPMAKLCVR